MINNSIAQQYYPNPLFDQNVKNRKSHLVNHSMLWYA